MSTLRLVGLGEKEVKEDNPSEGMYVRYYLIQNMFLILTDIDW